MDNKISDFFLNEMLLLMISILLVSLRFVLIWYPELGNATVAYFGGSRNTTITAPTLKDYVEAYILIHIPYIIVVALTRRNETHESKWQSEIHWC